MRFDSSDPNWKYRYNFGIFVIGHDIQAQGASSSNGLTEYAWNSVFVHELANRLFSKYDKTIGLVFTRPAGRNGLRKLTNYINDYAPKFVISFHCNAYDGKASGTETLYWHSSIEGKWMASRVQEAIVNTLRIPNRGLKPISKGERGWMILGLTQAPTIITEPFFIDNDRDLEVAQKKRNELLEAYEFAILEIARKFEVIA